jgi:hypothetical protein
MTPSELMQDFLDEETCLKARMLKVRDKRKVVGPVFVDLVTRLGHQSTRQMDQREVNALLPVLFLLAEWREPFAYRPTIGLMSRATLIVEHLLGDHTTENDGFRVVASMFDGDLNPLCAAIYNPRADEYVRGTLMNALVLIALANPERRRDVERFFKQFRTMCPEAPQEVMINWMDAIAELGMTDMSDSVRDAMRKGEILHDYTYFSTFEAKLQETIDGNGVPAGGRYRQFLVSDGISDLLS